MPDPRVLALLARTAAPASDGPADADLLTRFLDHRDQGALEALVRRHAGMVRAVCRAARLSPGDADDAFQATFLVFVRRAGAIRDRGSVGGWLYRVAYRVARRLRSATVANDPLPDDHPGRGSPPDSSAHLAELRRTLREEIGRLPQKYQVVVQLCYVAGRTTTEAADTLGCAKGTVLTRLAWARRRLRARLANRGVAPAAGSFAVLLGSRSGLAVPPDLARGTVAAARAVFAAGGFPVGVVSERTLSLSEGMVRAMVWNNAKLVAGLLLVATAAAVGLGVAQFGDSGKAVAQSPPPPTLPAPQTPPRQAPIPLPEPASLSIPELPSIPAIITAPPPTAPKAESKPPVKPSRTFQVESPVGGWWREVPVSGVPDTSKPVQVSLNLEGDRLTLIATATVQNESIRTVVDADYSINKESVLFGIVTSVDVQISETSKAKVNPSVFEEGQLFSFRFRMDDGVLTVKDARFPGAKQPEHGFDEFLTGRFVIGPVPAVSKSEKGMRSLPRRLGAPRTDTIPPSPTTFDGPYPRVTGDPFIPPTGSDLAPSELPTAPALDPVVAPPGSAPAPTAPAPRRGPENTKPVPVNPT